MKKQYRIHNDDNLNALQRYSDNYFDSVVTDPPYGLKFMGKNWDAGVPGEIYWREALRVAKPGAYMVAFGGTRTYHRLMVAIEDAGWTIKDCLMWVYGCYSEDTEVLTERGWLNYTEVDINKDKILQWNSSSEELSWISPLEKFEYEVDEELVSLSNDKTEQLITKNHKVWFKESTDYESTDYASTEAANLSKDSTLHLPLAGYLSGDEKNRYAYLTGIFYLYGWMPLESCFLTLSEKTLQLVEKYLNANKIEHEISSTGVIKILDKEVCSAILSNLNGYSLGYDTLNWNFSEKIELIEALTIEANSKLFEKTKVCSFNNYFSLLNVLQALCLSVGYGSSINKENCSITINKSCSTSIEPSNISCENYKGKVWCFRTETGAFVVRRKGKAFISGNSGFPKSYNVSKALDKMPSVDLTKFSRALKKRRLQLKMSLRDADEIITKGIKIYPHLEGYKGRPIYGPNKQQWSAICKHFGSDFCKKWEPLIKNHLKYAGPTDNFGYTEGEQKEKNLLLQPSVAANKVEGYGTSLKPAWEPIILAQKPLEGNIAQNIQKYGTGVLNIDGCRVGGEENKGKKYGTGKQIGYKKVEGRWPANFAHDGSKQVKNLFPNTASGAMKREIKEYEGESHTKMLRGKSGPSNQHGDAGSAARFFYCAKVSRKERNLGLDDAPDINISDKAKNPVGLKSGINKSSKSNKRKPNLITKNDHPTVKPIALMSWLVRLVTPHKNKKVLDLFMGSGSTGIAAAQEGHRFVGVELDKHSAQIALRRVRFSYNEETKV